MVSITVTTFIIFLATIVLFRLLLVSSHSENKYLKYLLVPSRKSTTGAILLGGIPVTIGSFIAILSIFGFTSTLLLWTIPSSLLLISGYLDDRFEVRARVKLAFQLLSVVSFALLFTNIYNCGTGTFSVLLFFGLGVINGANLLDGIDTYSIKYTVMTFVAISVIAFYKSYDLIGITSLMFTAPMCAFYFFNKSPSKVHLGEVGGAIIGMNLLFLCSQLYVQYSSGVIDPLNADALLFSFAFMHLPMTELGISLLRRVLKGRSPFCSDRLHVHLILTDIKGMSHSMASSKLSLLYGTGLAMHLLIMSQLGPTLSFFISGAYICSYYLYFGLETWSKVQEQTTLRDLFVSLSGNDIQAYDFSSLNNISFDFSYVDDFEQSENKVA